jgi:hypothetical protein
MAVVVEDEDVERKQRRIELTWKVAGTGDTPPSGWLEMVRLEVEARQASEKHLSALGF